MITHVVIFWTDKNDPAARARLLEGTRLLADIPGVLEYRQGPPVPSPRGVVDDSFTAAISMTFATPGDADSYQTHPLHQKFVQEYVKPLVRRFTVFDFGTA